MEESFVVFCASWSLHTREHIIDLHGNQVGVDHRVLGSTRMNAHTFNIETCLACVEVLKLDLALGISVQRVSVVCAKLFHIEVGCACTNLLIRCKCNTDGAVRDVLCLDHFDGSQDLSDTCLVVCAQDGCPVRCDQCAALE